MSALLEAVFNLQFPTNQYQLVPILFYPERNRIYQYNKHQPQIFFKPLKPNELNNFLQEKHIISLRYLTNNIVNQNEELFLAIMVMVPEPLMISSTCDDTLLWSPAIEIIKGTKKISGTDLANRFFKSDIYLSQNPAYTIIGIIKCVKDVKFNLHKELCDSNESMWKFSNSGSTTHPLQLCGKKENSVKKYMIIGNGIKDKEADSIDNGLMNSSSEQELNLIKPCLNSNLIICDLCKKNDSSIFCLTEQIYLCSDCDILHHKSSKIMSSHIRKPITAKDFFLCIKHNLPVITWCFCGEYQCHACISENKTSRYKCPIICNIALDKAEALDENIHPFAKSYLSLISEHKKTIGWSHKFYPIASLPDFFEIHEQKSDILGKIGTYDASYIFRNIRNLEKSYQMSVDNIVQAKLELEEYDKQSETWLLEQHQQNELPVSSIFTTVELLNEQINRISQSLNCVALCSSHIHIVALTEGLSVLPSILGLKETVDIKFKENQYNVIKPKIEMSVTVVE